MRSTVLNFRPIGYDLFRVVGEDDEEYELIAAS